MARQNDTGPLGLRLSLAFVGVALMAVALLSVLTAVFSANDAEQLSEAQRAKLTQAMSAVVGASRAEAGSWGRTDFTSAAGLAGKMGGYLEISDASDMIVYSSPGYAAETGPVRTAQVMADRHRVGLVTVRFGPGLGTADMRLRTEFWHAIAGAAGLAALLALVVAIWVSRRLTRPVQRLIEVATAVGAGDRSARAGDLGGPTELANLGATFDEMADALDRQEQLRRYLVADVAHELRTPVAVLQAGHEALLDGVVEPSTAQLVSLRDEVLRLARMVDDLQTLAAAEAAALQLSLKPGDLSDMALTAADSLAGRFESSQIALERDLEPAPVRADDRWMHQVITNLLTNAAKFTPVGGRVVLSTGTEGDRAVLRVADNGVGIPPGELPHIFERFWRGTNPTGAAGSGVGLAVVAELVRGHGGKIDVRSAVGRGTQITVYLPVA
jgi:two-component system, OmpR family, sensor histidine kinase BaeS